MKVLADLVVYPMGTTELDTLGAMAECANVVKAKKLKCHAHANGCNIEGEFDEVIEAIKAVQTTLHEKAPRVATDLRLVTQTDEDFGIESRMEKMEQLRK
jgi:uncharacterized protein (TIGR00106 family)